MTSPENRAARFRLVPMAPRDPAEEHRAASMLETFFDLVFVIAVSLASAQLHHSLTEGHVGEGLLSYAMVFFAIWWAWMNFTWFATSFDVDDWLYRLLTVLQMSGVLVLAAGVEPAFLDHDWTIVVVGYVIMRVAMIAQWLRASRSAGGSQRATFVYAGGIAVAQVLWVGLLFLPEQIVTVAFFVFVAVELLVPVVAERSGPTPWHPHHITERYGLFTIIVLGETLLASANAIIDAVHDDGDLGPLLAISALTLIVSAAIWWIYFWPPHHEAIDGKLSNSLKYGYAHYFIFAAVAAFSAGIEVEIDALTGETALGEVAASFTVTIPIAIFVFGVWALALRPMGDRVVNVAVPLGGLLVLLDPVLPVPVTLTAVVMAAIVVVLVVRSPDDARLARVNE